MEQSSFYNDAKDTKIEVHRVKTTRDVTRVETKVTSLPKPPPSFIIPRSRSTSPGPTPKGKVIRPVIQTLDSTGSSQRLSGSGSSSRTSLTASSPVRVISPSFPAFHQDKGGIPVSSVLQTGSLDRLSPATARRRFFESQQPSSMTLSWSDRRPREVNRNRNSRSLTGSTELYISESNDDVRTLQVPAMRNSVSMDDGVINVEPEPCLTNVGDNVPRSRSVENTSGKHHHSGIRDMLSAMKRKLRPKVKRSQSAREYDHKEKLQSVQETGESSGPSNGTHRDSAHASKSAPKIVVGTSRDSKSAPKPATVVADDSHVTQDQLTPIQIPDTEADDKEQDKNDKGRKVSGLFLFQVC